MDEIEQVLVRAKQTAETIAAKEVCLDQMVQVKRVLDGGAALDTDCDLAKRVAVLVRDRDRATAALGLVKSYAAVLRSFPRTSVQLISQEIINRCDIS